MMDIVVLVSIVVLCAYLHVWWCIWQIALRQRAAQEQLERIAHLLTQQSLIMSKQAAERLANENLAEGFARLLGAGEPA